MLDVGCGAREVAHENVLIVVSPSSNRALPRLGRVKRPLVIASAVLAVGAVLAIVLWTRPAPAPPLPEPITVSTPVVSPGGVPSSPNSGEPDDDDDDDDDDDGMVGPPPALDDVDDRDDFDDDDDDDADDD